MPIVSISIVPVGTNETSFSSQVANAVKRLEDRGIDYRVTPTCTIMQGELDELFLGAMDLHRAVLQNGVNRVITNITIDDRKDKQVNIEQQVQEVEDEINRRKRGLK
jgi:uncharacterized protein (TIGR00106 family)